MAFAPLALAACVLFSAAAAPPDVASRRAAEERNARLGDKVEWFPGQFFAALNMAEKEEKHIFVAFLPTDWSPRSKQLVEETFSQSRVAKELAELVCYRVDEPTSDLKDRRVAQRFDVTEYPTIVVLMPDGSVEDAIFGFIDADSLILEMRRITSGTDTVSDLRKQVEASPKDLALRYRLAVKLRNIGARKEYEDQLRTIKEADPKGKTVTGARLIMWEVQNECESSGNFKPLETHLNKLPHSEIRFEGWDYLVAVLRERQDPKGMRRAYMKACSSVGDEMRLEYGMGLIETFWEQRAQLSKSEEKFTLEVAEEAARDWASAREREELSVGDDPEFDRGEAYYLSSLARAQYLNGKRTKALATIERSIGLAPGEERFGELKELFKKKS